MGVPPAEQCNESETVCTDPASASSLVIEEHPKNVSCPAHSTPYEGDEDHRPTSWFFCDENQFRLRNSLHQPNPPRLPSAEKLICIGDHQKCEEPSIEDKNNAEVCVTPAIQVRLESNDVSAADQTLPGSVQLNDIEAKCKHQKTLETVFKAASTQECFERKLSETWKQECTTYDDLNRNIPSLTPYDDQSRNLADSGFVKMILQSSRKKLNAALDIRVITDNENSINAGSLDPEIQQKLDENYSPPPPDVTVVSMEDRKIQAAQEQQQKVACFPSKKSRKAKGKRQQGLKEPKQQPKKFCSSSVMKKNKKRRQKKRHGSSRLRSRTRGSRCIKQATKPKERGTSLHRKQQGHVSDISGFEDEPNDAESSTPWQRDSCSPTKQGNSSSSGDRNNDKGGGRVSRNGGMGGGTGEKNDDNGDSEEPPPGKDGESHIDITAAEWQRKLARVRERQNAGYLNLQAPFHQGNMPPEVLRDETEDQAPSDFNLKPPPDSNKLSLSADTSGFSGNAEASGAVMQSDPILLLHERVRNDSGFLSGPSSQVPTQPLKHDIPRKKPVSIACPEPSRFHPMVAESNGVIPREPEGAVGDQGAVTADTTFDPAFQKLARPPLLPRFPDVESTATLYNSLEYFDWENQAQDNVLGSPYTHFVSTVDQEQHLGRHSIPRPREDQHHVHPAVDHEGMLGHPSEESTPCVDRVEMVGYVTPFLPPDVVCSPPSACEPANGVEPANAPTALLHANFESRIVGVLSSPDLWTFTPQSDMYVPSVEPQTLVN